MRQARRRFFVESALLCALSRVTPTRAALPRSIPLPEATLRAYVDVLIPADETPSATALGVDKKLLVMAKGRPDYHRLLALGFDWLNTQAQFKHGRNFAQLDETSRDAIVGRAAAAGHGTPPRVF